MNFFVFVLICIGMAFLASMAEPYMALSSFHDNGWSWSPEPYRSIK